MTARRKVRVALQAALFVACLLTPVQEARAQQPSQRDGLIAAAREIMQAARYCALITRGDSGQLRVRTMDPFLPEDDMTVWLGTHRKTRKVQDIQNDPHVALYFFAPDAGGYVSISGTARLVDDPIEKARRWKEGWGRFYTDRETDYLLIEVSPERMEVVSYGQGIVGDPDTWNPPAVEFQASQM